MNGDVLPAVLEPRRRAILRVLAEGDLPVGELARRFDVSRPAISQHLAVLRAAGLVALHPQAGRNRYSLLPEGLAAARRGLAGLADELPGGADGADAPDLAVALHARAPAERVFALLTTAAGLARWLGSPDGEPRAGAGYRIDLGGDVAAGTFLAIQPHERVVFGWGQEGGPMAPDSSRVEVRLSPAAEGTLVTLEQRGLPPELHAPHLGSWASHLPRLAAAAGSA